MSRFDGFLSRTGERLMLPKATRRLILVEIASDLEDLFQFYLEQGLSEEQAAARAEEKVDMSDEALAELVRVHSQVRSWTDRLGKAALPFWERIAMSLLVLFFAAAAAVSVDARTFAHLTSYIWPVVVILGLLVVTFATQLMRAGDHQNPRRVRDRLATPLFLGAGSVVVGFLSAGIQLYRALERMAANPRAAGRVFGQAILGSTATLVCALLVALVAGVVWFVLAGRAARLEDAVADRFTGVS